MRTLLLTLFLLALALPAVAAVPQTLSFQGVLTDESGDPLSDGGYLVHFRIYNAPSGGDLIWSQSAVPVTVVGGVFSVQLGEGIALDAPFDEPYWLEIQRAQQQTMSPRLPLTAAPYSRRSESVEDGAIDAAALSDGTAVRSLNGLTDTVQIVGGANVTVTPSTGQLVIDATGGSGGADSDWVESSGDIYRLSGNVRIGASAGPDVKLYVTDSGSSTVLQLDNNSQSQLHLDAGSYQGFLTAQSGEVELEATGSQADIRLNSPERIYYESNYHSFVYGSTNLTERARLGWDASWEMLDPNSTRTVRLYAGSSSGDVGGQLQLYNASSTATVEIDASDDGDGTDAATLILRNANGSTTVELDAQEGGATGGAQLNLLNGAGTRTVELDGDFGSGKHANLRMYSQAGVKTVELDAVETGAADQGAALKLYNDAGELTIELDADHGSSDEGRIIADVIEIQGGSDLSEQFDVAAFDRPVEPGMVVSIDPSRPGGLQITTEPYDRRVAGIVSGANGVRPGMLMGQRGSEADGEHPVALTGRVYCWADAEGGPIEPGDLLTTSGNPGHAMRVDDSSRAQGAILGKAMTSLDTGTGMVLVLVGLQ